MKRIALLPVFLAVLLSLAGCGRSAAYKTSIFTLVEENYDTIVTACSTRDIDALLALEGVTDVRTANGYVLVYCKGAGIATSSQDYGFYFTEDNIPVGVDCNLGIVCSIENMQPVGNGYEGTVDHNTFYTEQIQGNIYYYSNAY